MGSYCNKPGGPTQYPPPSIRGIVKAHPPKQIREGEDSVTGNWGASRLEPKALEKFSKKGVPASQTTSKTYSP